MDTWDKIGLQRSQGTQDEDTTRVAATCRHPSGVRVDRSHFLVQVDEFAEHQCYARTVTRGVVTQCACVSRRDSIVSAGGTSRGLRQLE
jgi:hypothetical protein